MLDVLFAIWFKEFLSEIMKELPEIEKEHNRYIKTDMDFSGKIKSIVAKHRANFEGAYLRVGKQRASEIFQTVDQWNKKQQDRVNERHGLGIQSSVWKNGVAEAFVSNNVGLIKKLSDEVFGKIEESIFRNLQVGKTSTFIVNETEAVMARVCTCRWQGSGAGYHDPGQGLG